VKILHTSDWHVGRSIRGRSRAEEHRAVLDEIVEIAADGAVDVVLIAGDLFDTGAPSPESESIVFRALLDLADIAPVVAVAGNHDNARRFAALEPLLRLGRISIGSGLRRPDEGGILDVPGVDCRVAMVPWTSQRGIVKADDLMELDPDDHGLQYAGRMERIVAALCQPMTLSTVNVVLSHVMVHGATETGSERQAHIFGYAVPPTTFPSTLSYVALGHLHRQQRIPYAAPTWYAGSPLQLDFGEVDDRKGVLVIDAEPGLPAKVTAVPLESGKRLGVVRGTVAQIEAAIGETEAEFLKIFVEEPSRAGLATEIRDLSDRIVDVVIAASLRVEDTHESQGRLRRPEDEVFAEYLSSRNIEDPAVVGLFRELLDQVDAT
jgi:exonuclease SbcD